MSDLNELNIEKVKLQYIKRIIVFACFAFSNMRKSDPQGFITKVSEFISKNLRTYSLSFRLEFDAVNPDKEQKRDFLIDELISDEGSDHFNVVTIYYRYPSQNSPIREFSIDLRYQDKYVDFLYL